MSRAIFLQLRILEDDQDIRHDSLAYVILVVDMEK